MTKVEIKDIPRFIIGASAIGVSLLLVFGNALDSLNLIVGFYLVIICTIDSLYSKIPNFCNIVLLVAGFIYNSIVLGPATGIFNALLGFAVGLALLMIPYLFGGVGGGDVKALAALGALLGPGVVIQVFLYVAIFGGIFSILHYLFSSNILSKVRSACRSLIVFLSTHEVQSMKPNSSEKLRFPYAAAFAFGFFTYTSWGDIFSLIKGL